MAPQQILVGVCGGIAAYKACSLVSALVQRGHKVDVILTEEAQRFITPLTFSALTRRRVWLSLWDAPEAIPHIDLVRAADVFIIAPATAQTIAKLALGFADDLLSNAALATKKPLIVAPAMNSAMYEHPATQQHLATLRERHVDIIEPEVGFLAERETGIGRLAQESRILAAIDSALSRVGIDAQNAAAPVVLSPLRGRRMLITAGPTREAFDPVRFLSNAATGCTGIELALEAHRRGAEVTLVLGPTTLPVPASIRVMRVQSAAEMLAACETAIVVPPDFVLATAAVADHRPRLQLVHKAKKREELDVIALEPTVDIIATLRDRLSHACCIGFAAETQDHEINARLKLVEKCLDAIVYNDVSSGQGFGAVRNTWTLLTATDKRELGSDTKDKLAHHLLDAIERLYCS